MQVKYTEFKSLNISATRSRRLKLKLSSTIEAVEHVWISCTAAALSVHQNYHINWVPTTQVYTTTRV